MEPRIEEEEDAFPTRLEGEGIEHASLRSGTSPELSLVKESFRSWHWAGYKQMFDMAALICTTDRQYDKVHKAIMDIAAEQERTMRVLINRLWMRREAQEKEKKA